MQLTPLDWAIIAGYFIVALAIGLVFSRRAGRSLAEYFVSGRSLPWWIAGTSMVATTFATDTPLAVTGLVAKYGLAGNWFWWAMALSGTVTVFVFARLWRRAEVLTDVELIEMRYGGKPAAFLRGFRALYVALLINSIIIGWVTGAMLDILKFTVFSDPAQHPSAAIAAQRAADAGDETDLTAPALPEGETVDQEIGGPEAAPADAGARDWAIIVGMLLVVGVYATLSGMWGVALTDFLQFFLAMAGSIALAVIAVRHVGGVEAMQAQVAANFGGGEQAFRYLPDFTAMDPWMPFDAFMIMVTIQWWSTWYPGAEPGGGGYVVQRMASCKDERHSLLATMWFQIAHYCVRPWPWLLVAFVGLAMYPDLRSWDNPGVAFPQVITDLAPAGLRGLLLVTFFAAFMSTLSTQLNWAASYLVNDFYKRFIRPDATDRQLTTASRLVSLLVLIIGGVTAYAMRDISVDEAWKMMVALSAGTGAVFMLRWFWWRINAWTEIAAMVGSLVFFLLAKNWLPGFLQENYQIATSDIAGWEQIEIALIASSTIVVWLLATFLTPSERTETLEGFYRKIRPAGPGWKPMAALAPDVETDKNLGLSIVAALLGAAVIYLVLPCVGFLIFGNYTGALLTLAGAAVCSVVIYLLMQKIGWKEVLR